MASIKRLPEKVVRNWFWKMVDAFIYPELFPPCTFKRDTYLELYAVMYDKGWLTEDDLWLLDHNDLPVD